MSVRYPPLPSCHSGSDDDEGRHKFKYEYSLDSRQNGIPLEVASKPIYELETEDTRTPEIIQNISKEMKPDKNSSKNLRERLDKDSRGVIVEGSHTNVRKEPKVVHREEREEDESPFKSTITRIRDCSQNDLIHPDTNSHKDSEKTFKANQFLIDLAERNKYNRNGKSYGRKTVLRGETQSDAGDSEKKEKAKPNKVIMRYYDQATPFVAKILTDPNDQLAINTLTGCNKLIKREGPGEFIIDIRVLLHIGMEAKQTAEILANDPRDKRGKKKQAKLEMRLRETLIEKFYPKKWLACLPWGKEGREVERQRKLKQLGYLDNLNAEDGSASDLNTEDGSASDSDTEDGFASDSDTEDGSASDSDTEDGSAFDSNTNSSDSSDDDFNSWRKQSRKPPKKPSSKKKVKMTKPDSRSDIFADVMRKKIQEMTEEHWRQAEYLSRDFNEVLHQIEDFCERYQ